MADVKAAVTEEVVYRIEVSLSSRKSSVVVMRTMAKLYSLHNSGGDAEWKMLALGVPCILLQRVSTEHNSPFAVKVVIAELETGNVQWEGEVNHDSQYQAMQANFHAFAVNKQTFALQFVSPPEASRMLVSIRDFVRQKEETDIVNFNQSNQGKSKSKPKRKTSKKNISNPLNFKHVTNITNQHRSTGDELGSNFTRHQSFSGGDRPKPANALADSAGGTTGQQGEPPNPQGNPLYAEIGEHLLEDKAATGGPPQSNMGPPVPNHKGLPPQNLGPLMRGSVRLPKKQEEGDDDIDEPLIERGSLRHSLPSHLKQRVRVPLNRVNFEGPHALPSRLPEPTGASDQVDSGRVPVPYPTSTPAFPGQRLDQGPMLSSQPNLVAFREMGVARFPTQSTQPPSSAVPAHTQKPYPDSGYQGNADLGHNSLPRLSGSNPFGSQVPNNLRLLSAGPISASMPSMERGLGGPPLPPPLLAPVLEHYPGQPAQHTRQSSAGMGGVAGPFYPPPPLLNPSPHLRSGAASGGGGAATPAPPTYAGPTPGFVPPPPFSHPHRTVPSALSTSVTPPTPSTPSTPVPPPSALSSNVSKTVPPSVSTATPSPLYDVLPPLQQPSPKPAKTDADLPPKQDVRARPSSYVQWPSTARNGNGTMLGHDSLRSADLHATDV